jgi:2-oxoacid:acceptor oxidoreductase delta subunit (pyruvate/2-ketoisovalerate family)
MEKGTAIKHDLKKAPITGYWRYARPAVDKKKCVGCGTCVKYCPEAAIELTNDQQPTANNKKGIADIDYCFCKGCGVCARECPQKAIKMEKESASIKYQV